MIDRLIFYLQCSVDLVCKDVKLDDLKRAQEMSKAIVESGQPNDVDLFAEDKDLLETACEDLSLEMPAGKSFDMYASFHSMQGARIAKDLIRIIVDLLLNLCQDEVSKRELVQPHLPILHGLAKRCFGAIDDKLESLALYHVVVKASEVKDVSLMFFLQNIDNSDSADQKFLGCLSQGLVNKSSLEDLKHEVEAKIKVMNGIIPAALIARETNHNFQIDTILRLYEEIFQASYWEGAKDDCIRGLWMIAFHNKEFRDSLRTSFSSMEPPRFSSAESQLTIEGFLFHLGIGRYHDYILRLQSKLKPGEAERKQRMNVLKELVETERKYVREAELVVESYGVKIKAAFAVKDNKGNVYGNKKKKELLSNYDLLLKAEFTIERAKVIFCIFSAKWNF